MLMLAASTLIASAHAHLKSTSVGIGAVLIKAPDAITLVFDEESSADETTIEVLNEAGEEVHDGDPTPKKDDAKTWMVKLKANLPDGAYTVNYRTVTEDDGGVIEGGFAFKIAAKGTAVAGITSAGNDLGEREVQPEAPGAGLGGNSADNSNAGQSWFTSLLLLASIAIGSGGLLLVLRRKPNRPRP